MLTLNEKSKQHIRKDTGLTVEEITDCPVDRLDSLIGDKVGKKIEISIPQKPYLRSSCRGSVYLWLARLADIGAINKKLSRI